MTVLLAVIEDLWTFAYQNLFGFRIYKDADTAHLLQQQLPLDSTQDQPLPEGTFAVEQQYFIRRSDVYLYTDPEAFEATVLQHCPYGQSVLVKKLGADWAQVSVAGVLGWIQLYALAERAEDVYPQFSKNQIYGAANPETIKMWAYLNFSTYSTVGHIRPAEYVLYRIKRAKRSVPEDFNIDTPLGTWQQVLRGKSGVHIGLMPRTGSVIEYSIDGIGFIAHVDSVFPDQSIEISEFGMVVTGQYTRRVLAREEYREMAPVFISFT